MTNIRHLGKSVAAIFIISFALFITGCWDSHELDKQAIVSGVGFDIDLETGIHMVTYQSIIPNLVKSGNAGGSGEQTGGEGITPAVRLDHLNGNTWVEPLGNYATQGGTRTLFFPHNQVIILSMEVAQQGVYPLIEHILRLTQSRPNRLILVSRDKASDILSARAGIGVIPGIGIAGDVKLSSEFSKYPAITVLEFANRMISKTTTPILPITSIFEETDPDGKKFNKVQITGTAVFKEYKIIGELNEQESRGLLWIIDRIKKGFLVVDAPDGSGKASLSITRSKSKMIPEMTEGKITITVEIEEQADLTEYPGRQNLDPILLKQLEESQADAIQQEVMAALNKSFALNADVFGFGEAVHRKYKKEWPQLASRWDDIYPEIEVAIKVKTHINETGDTSKAIIPQ